jgi:hypothetical protein
MIEILIPTLLYMLPVAGATFTSFKLLYRFVRCLLHKRKSESANVVDYLKPAGMILVSIWGIIMFSFMALCFWFPTIDISQNVRTIGIIILVPYIIVVGSLYGLSRAVASGAGSATGVISGMSDMISGDDKNRKGRRA